MIPVDEAVTRWRKDPVDMTKYNALEQEFALLSEVIKARAAAGRFYLPGSLFSGLTRKSQNQLQERHELILGQPGLRQDRAQRPGLDCLAGMDRHGGAARPVGAMDENVMTAVDPLDDEAAAFKGSHDVKAAQLSQLRIHAAEGKATLTRIFRICGT